LPKDNSGHFNTIKEAIDVATPGDLILVDEGTYFENINFHGKAITVASQFYVDQNEQHIINTIIDGSRTDNFEIGSVVSFVSGENTSSVLNGFTITRGTGSYVPPGALPVPMYVGGGINCSFSGPMIINNYIHDNAINFFNGANYGGGISTGPSVPGVYPIIENNKVYDNLVNGFFNPSGGGIYMFNSGRIKDNEVYNNSCFCGMNQSAGGGVVCAMGEIDVSGNNIYNNEAVSPNKGLLTNWGGIAGGLIIYMCNGKVENNTIANNHITASDADSASSPGVLIEMCTQNLLFSNNMVTNNTYNGGECYGGGVGIWYGGATLINNLITGNQAKYGAGISIADTTVQEHKTLLINNTLTENIADSLGGGMFVELWTEDKLENQYDTVVMTNNIIWGDQSGNGEEIFHVQGDMLVTYSNIQGPWPGNGNIDVDPQFVGTGDYPFFLADNSPCVNTGTPDTTGLNLPEFDLAGNPRLYGGRIEMGAYENQVVVGLDNAFTQNKLGLNVFPNPFKYQSTIEFTLPESDFVTLSFYDIAGKQLETILSKKLSKGEHKINWNAKGLNEGIYFIQLGTLNQTITKKIILLE
jgi:hypothetical protein